MTSGGQGGTTQQWHISETYKGLVTLSVEALKMLMLINGAAAISLLTYIGNLQQGKVPHGVNMPLLWYCGGVLAASIAMIVAYITQLCLFNEEKKKAEGGSIKQWHMIGIFCGFLFAVASAVAFGRGCLLAASMLSSVVC
jgi:hypothetical protein